jgi:hypothetical protein
MGISATLSFFCDLLALSEFRACQVLRQLDSDPQNLVLDITDDKFRKSIVFLSDLPTPLKDWDLHATVY